MGGLVLTVLGRSDLLFKVYFHICPYITDLSRKFAFHINDPQLRGGRFIIHYADWLASYTSIFTVRVSLQ